MPKLYKDDFTNERRLAWVRFVSQCRYRGEICELTFSEFCQFWSTPSLWSLRGRTPSSLCLTRYDPQGPWTRDNCCIITRRNQLCIRNDRRAQKPVEHYYAEAIDYAG